MGIQINGQTDIVTSTTAGGKVTIPTATFPSVSNINATGVSTFSGGIIVSAGSTTAPSISPSGDSNTGIFFPSPDTVAIGEGGTEALRVDSSGNVGIATASPLSKVHIQGTGNGSSGSTGLSDSSAASALLLKPLSNSGTALALGTRNTGGHYIQGLYAASSVDSVRDIQINPYGGSVGIGTFADAFGGAPGNSTFVVATSGIERSRIDSSGRLLIGTSSAPTSGDPQYAKLVVSGNTASSTGDSFINITRNLAASSISSGSPIGAIFFTESSGGVYAQIQGVCDATGGTNDYPGRLSFYITADGASSQTERLRIDNAGRLGINNTSQSTNPDRTIIFGSSTDKYALHLSMANNAASGAVNTAALRIDGTQGRGTGVYYGIQVDVSEIDVGTCYGTYSKATGTYGQQYAVYGEISKNLAAFTSAYGVYSKLVTSNSGGGAYFYWGDDNGTTRFYVGQNGGIGNYQANNTNLSDEREKKDIVNLDSTWECLKHWEIKKFRYNEDADSVPEKYGVIAQQVQQHCPEVIDEWIKQAEESAKLDENGNEIEPAKEKITRMAVKEQQMYWMAIKALQEAQERIEMLETEVVELKSKVI